MVNKKKMMTMVTVSILATEDQIENLYADLAALGWRLTYQGNSNTWLGEPIYMAEAVSSTREEREENTDDDETPNPCGAV